MDNNRKKLRNRMIITILIAIIIILFGFIMVLNKNNIINQIGIAFIVAGIVGIANELAFGDYWKPKEDTNPIILQNTDITFMQSPRIGFDEYYKWILQDCPSEIFLAGRSVLHRLEKDLQEKELANIEDCIARRMREGANIKVLFLNPLWEFSETIACKEGRRNPKEFYSDLKISLKIVKKIYDKIKSISILKGSIDIRMYGELSQYAYHSVKNNEDDYNVYVGFYFIDTLGWQSAVYKINTERSLKRIEKHFITIFDNAAALLTRPENSCGLTEFNQLLFTQALSFVEGKL